MRKNSELRNAAVDTLSGKWGNGAVVTLIYFLITIALAMIVGEKYVNLVSLLLLPLEWGVTCYFLSLYRRNEVRYPMIFEGYKDFGRIFLTLLLLTIYTMLWALLLIVPGVIKGFSYVMTPFILRDEPDMKNNAAIEKSMAMMKGHKMQFFLLELSFIGWGLLSCLTLGIGFLFLLPYMYTAYAAFYEDVKAEYESRCCNE